MPGKRYVNYYVIEFINYMYQFDLFLFMKKSTVMLWAIFGALLMGCSDEEIANVETSSRNAIGFNVLSNAAETRATQSLRR